MPEESWTSDTHVGDVPRLVDLFRTTFVFEIKSSGYYTVPDNSSDRQSEGGRFDVRYVRGVRWVYGYHICNRWSVLSNFRIRKFFIRATYIGTGNYRQTAREGGDVDVRSVREMWLTYGWRIIIRCIFRINFDI